MPKTMNTNARKNAVKMAPIQSGDKTHTHGGQSMLCVSFRTMKTIVSSPINPIPPELDDEVEFAIGLLCE